MARTYANILTAIWADEDFCALTAGPQRTYFMLVTQPDITAAGTLALTVRRWSLTVAKPQRPEFPAWLGELRETQFVLVDEETEELLVRTFVKHDGGHKHPKRLAAVWANGLAIRSRQLREGFGFEMAKLGLTLPSGLASECRSDADPEPSESPRDVVNEGDHSSQPTSQEPHPASLEPAAQRPAPKRGTRLPDDWRPSDTCRAWTLERLSSADAATELEKFRNWWTAKTGRDATKLDWDATWRYWVLNSRGTVGRGGRRPTTDQRVRDGLDLAARLRAEEAVDDPS